MYSVKYFDRRQITAMAPKQLYRERDIFIRLKWRKERRLW